LLRLKREAACIMRILGIDPGLQRTGFGCGVTSAGADVSLRRSPCCT